MDFSLFTFNNNSFQSKIWKHDQSGVCVGVTMQIVDWKRAYVLSFNFFPAGHFFFLVALENEMENSSL